MSTPVIVALTWIAIATPLPDGLDHLRTGDARPNIGLLLDASCSMRSGTTPTTCAWFAANHTGSTSLNKNEMLRAALVGCESSEDGILDIWAGRVNFSIFKFGHANDSAAMVTPFGADLAAMEAGALTIPAAANTPMSFALREHAKYFQTYFNNSNTLSCRSNFLLLLSDGDPNGGAATFDFNCPVSGDPRATVSVPAREPWLGAKYLTDHRDYLCAVTGDQQIRTYTLGFGAPGSFSPTNLQQIARSGHGEYYDASNIHQLHSALEAIISKMAARSGLFFSAPAVQLDQLFTGNDVYIAGFKPHGRGRWGGTLKRYCVEPDRRPDGAFDPSDRRCIFRAESDGRTLYTNPGAVDFWTGSTTTAADVGGAADVLLDRLGPGGGTPRAPVRPRNIVTWRADAKDYAAVQPSSWRAQDSGMAAAEHDKLINFLHGYTWDADPNGAPRAVSDAPLGDPVNSPTVLLRYRERCDQPRSCWVVVGMNDGMLHFFDAADGSETTGLIPAEAWLPNGIAHERLASLEAQPDADVTHRYFVDGGMLLYHDDASGDGVIQASETSYLIFGLGRGGAAYYQIPVSRFDGTLRAADNPVRPLVRSPGTSLGDLRDTWATPWAGPAKFDGQPYSVAVFPTGHVRDFDDPLRPMPGLVETAPITTVEKSIGCPAVANAQGLSPHACEVWNGNGYADPAPQTVVIGPFAIAGAVAYRLRFVGFDVHTKDRLELIDSQGIVVESMTDSGPAGGLSAWVHDTSFSLRWITNGKKTKDRGWHVGQIEYAHQSGGAKAPLNPGVFVVDLARWNGATPQPFAGSATDSGVLLRIARRCAGGAARCIDATVSPELEGLTCPISGEPSVYTVAGALRAIYWGDECGQLWKAWAADEEGQLWKARKLLSLNRTGPLEDPAVAAGSSKDLRKIFRKLDLVPTGCPGRRALGIYFGTGNVQRPAATDELTDPGLTHGRDVIGVLWDTADLPEGLSLDDLEDATQVAAIDPKAAFARGRRGWFLSLAPSERMLRDPLVFEAVAYFKTFRPVNAALECSAAAGTDAIYAVDNCTAAAVVDGPGSPIADRQAWSGHTDVGGGLLLFTPKNGAPLVTHGNLQRTERAALVDQRRGRIPRIFLWREPKAR